MAELFELSAALRIDLTSFERDVKQAMAMAAQLEQTMNALRQSTASVMSAVRMTAGSVGAPQPIAARGAAGAPVQADDLARAVSQAMNGVSVQMDGQAVGRLVAPTVDEQIGRMARARRYTG